MFQGNENEAILEELNQLHTQNKSIPKIRKTCHL